MRRSGGVSLRSEVFIVLISYAKDVYKEQPFSSSPCYQGGNVRFKECGHTVWIGKIAEDHMVAGVVEIPAWNAQGGAA